MCIGKCKHIRIKHIKHITRSHVFVGIFAETTWTCNMVKPTTSLTCDGDSTDGSDAIKLNVFMLLFGLLILVL